MATNRIKKIKLTDGSIYAIFDEGALRLSDPSSEGRVLLLANNPVVDNIILQGSLEIDEVDDVPVSELNPEVVFRDPTTGKLQKLALDDALVKMGVKEYAFQQTNGTLWLGTRDVGGSVISEAVF